ncbi:MAG: ankyrin repeat domain-containing protein [Candidatus Aminicenantes bacterium]|nr:MAG: ankyrin repeat domain-containing protein [Candidatus Aminicenantes bacterium]
MEITRHSQQPEEAGKKQIYKKYDPTNTIIWTIGIVLLISFVFPIAFYQNGTLKFTTLNIEALVEFFFGEEEISNHGLALVLYPLLAGLLAILAARWKRGMARTLVLFAIGLLPFIILILFSLQVHQALEVMTGRSSILPGGILASIAGALALAATFAILAGAYAVQLNPDKKIIWHTAAAGGIIYLILLLIPVNGQFSFILSFRILFARDPSGTGITVVFGLVTLIIYVIMIIIAFQCLILEGMKTNRVLTGKSIIILWLTMFFLLLGLAIYITFITAQSQGISSGDFFLFVITALIKFIPWILAPIFLVSLGTAESLLITGTPEDTLKDMFKAMRRILPRVLVAAEIFILILLLFVILYYSSRPGPKTTAYFFEAIRKGDTEKVKILMWAGVDVNAVNKRGSPPLFLAVGKNNLKVVRMLVDRGANVNARNKALDTPLIAASKKGNIEIVRLLIDKGAHVNDSDGNGNTSLHYAAKPLTALTLIEKGALVSAANNSGDTPLHHAVHSNRLEVAETLISKGANINRSNRAGESPFHLAVETGNTEVVRFLLDNGGDVNKPAPYRFSPLHAAAKKGYVEITRLLLEKGAEVNYRDKQGRTALHFAVRYKKRSPKTVIKEVELVKTIIDYGAEINARNNEGNTPLHGAVSRGVFEVVETLVEKGADVNAKNNSGATPLEMSRPYSYSTQYRQREINKIVNYLKSRTSE